MLVQMYITNKKYTPNIISEYLNITIVYTL